MADRNIVSFLGDLFNSPIKDLRQIAYVLATVKHEVGNTFTPIEERGNKDYFNKYEPNTSIGKALGNIYPGDGYLFRGRGYIQLTGRSNYYKFGSLLGIDLANNPELANRPDIAWNILEIGMTRGLFTGKKLENYFNGTLTDWFNARRIINGLNKAELIASYGKQYFEILKELYEV